MLQEQPIVVPFWLSETSGSPYSQGLPGYPYDTLGTSIPLKAIL